MTTENQKPQPKPMSAAEVHRMLQDPEWWKKIGGGDIGVRAGQPLTEAQFREYQARKRAAGGGGAGGAPTVIRQKPQ